MATAHLRYHYEPEGWWAESPEYPGYSAFGASLEEVRLLAHEGLRFFAEDEALEVVDPLSELLNAAALTVGVAPKKEKVPDYGRKAIPLPDEARSAAEDRWCHEVSPHEAHAWSESGQAYLCDGVPRDDAQTPSAATDHAAMLAIRRVIRKHPRGEDYPYEEDAAEVALDALLAENERLSKALGTISRMTRIADPEVHEIAKEALRDA